MDTCRRIIDRVNEIKPAPTYSDTALLGWINEVDGAVWNEIYGYTIPLVVATVVAQTAYDVPVGYVFEDIIELNVDGVPYPRVSKLGTTGFYRTSTGKIGIYPAPTAIGSMDVLMSAPYVPHTIDLAVLAGSPFDKMYIHYLSAMIDFNRREYASYNNTLQLFNTAYEEYQAWITGKKPLERSAFLLNLHQQGSQSAQQKSRT
jgi:hypothetical protein